MNKKHINFENKVRALHFNWLSRFGPTKTWSPYFIFTFITFSEINRKFSICESIIPSFFQYFSSISLQCRIQFFQNFASISARYFNISCFTCSDFILQLKLWFSKYFFIYAQLSSMGLRSRWYGGNLIGICPSFLINSST